MDRIQTWLAEAQAHRRDHGRPLVTLSYAQSLDGCITFQRGQPLALSGEASLVFTHQLRAAHQGILVGIGTILADNPRLDVRLVSGENPQPVVLDSQLRFPQSCKLMTSGRQPWIAHTRRASQERRDALETAGVRLLAIPEDGHHQIHLPALLGQLAALGIESLMVEGGVRVITRFLSARLVDQIILTIAPRFLGGVHAPENWTESPDAMAGNGTSGGAESGPIFPRLKTWQAERVGEDLILWGIPDWESLAASSVPQTFKKAC